MSRTFKVVTVAGTSAESLDDAIQSAVADASGTLRNLGWFEVQEIRGRIENGGVLEYQVKLELGFRVEGE
ncbi:MAG: dodecin [Thermoanaerobaculia bacterium]